MDLLRQTLLSLWQSHSDSPIHSSCNYDYLAVSLESSALPTLSRLSWWEKFPFREIQVNSKLSQEKGASDDWVTRHHIRWQRETDRQHIRSSSRASFQLTEAASSLGETTFKRVSSSTLCQRERWETKFSGNVTVCYVLSTQVNLSHWSQGDREWFYKSTIIISLSSVTLFFSSWLKCTQYQERFRKRKHSSSHLPLIWCERRECWVLSSFSTISSLLSLENNTQNFCSCYM